MSCPSCGFYKINETGLCHECDKKLRKGKKSLEGVPEKSKKQTVADKAYGILRAQFMNSNSRCMARLIGCTGAATELHHGFSGMNRAKYYLDTSTWFALCHSCHDKLHNVLSAESARRLGLKLQELPAKS